MLLRESGFGIRRATSLALSAFLASSVSTSDLQGLILSAYPPGVDDEVHSARSSWSTINGLSYPSDKLAVRQRSWDAPSIARGWNTIWKGPLDELDQARLIVLKARHCSDWQFGPPTREGSPPASRTEDGSPPIFPPSVSPVLPLPESACRSIRATVAMDHPPPPTSTPTFTVISAVSGSTLTILTVPSVGDPFRHSTRQ